jgi:cytochrome c
LFKNTQPSSFLLLKKNICFFKKAILIIMGYLYTYLLFFLAVQIHFGCQNANSEGEKLYKEYCANCHMDDGKGLEGLIPPLAQSDYLQYKKNQLACLIQNGLNEKMVVNGREYEGKMPANPKLSEVEIANILNYIQNAWGNKAEFISIQTVKDELKNCK